MSNKNVIGDLLGGSVGSQADLARRADLAKSTVNKAVNGGGMGWVAALKAAPALGVDGPVLYAAVNLKAALEGDSSEALERIGRIVRTLGQKDVDEDAEGLDEVLTAIEKAIESLTGVAPAAVASDPAAKTATKNAGVHSAFKSTFDRVGVGSVQPRPEDYNVDDGRDLHGKKVKLLPEDYGDELDSGYDDEDLEGRDGFGQRVRPMDRR